VPLFIDRLPFHVWIDSTRTPPLTYWTVVLPVILAEPTFTTPPAVALVQEWALDTGNRGEAFAWRHHLVQAGLNPDQLRLPQPMTIRTVAGRVTVPVRDADLWLVSNLTVSPPPPYRLVLHRGLPFQDTTTIPDPQFPRPLVGMRALRSARLRIEIDYANEAVSIWTPDPPGP
jgi:hypothetical protein